MAESVLTLLLQVKDKATASLTKFGKGFNKLNSTVDRTSRKLTSLNSGLARLGATVSAGLVIRKYINTIVDFEAAMINVSTLVDTSAVNMKHFGDEIIKMSSRVNKPAKDLADGLYQVISAGVDAGDALGVLEVSAKAAAAGLTTTEKAVDIITTVLNAYELSAENAIRVSDVLFSTVRLGKCVTGDTLILQPDGTEKRIDSLLAEKDKPVQDIPSNKNVKAITFNGKRFVPVAAKWWYRGKKELKILKTVSGRKIKSTPEHLFLTPFGWKKIKDISVGDYITVPAELPFFGNITVGREYAELAGMLLGDGSIGFENKSTPRIHSSDNNIRKHVISMGKSIGLCPVVAKNDKGKVYHVSLRANENRGGKRTNFFTDWLRKNNFVSIEQSCKTKYIPESVWKWNKQDLKYFLIGLFESDGWLALTKTGRNKRSHYDISVGFGSASKQMAKDVQRALLKFGICSALKYKKVFYDYKGERKESEAWSVDIKRGHDIRLFLDRIGFGKKYPDKIVKAKEILKWKPYEINRIGQATTERIVSIEDAPAEKVYDLTVNHKASNFVANSIIAHNTTFDELSTSLGQMIPFAVSLGIEIEEVGAAMATLTAAGLSTDIASTALRATFTSLVQQSDKFRKAGVDVIEVAGKKGLVGVMKELRKITGGNIEKMREFVPETRALAAVLSLTGSQAESFVENLKEVEEGTGATQDAFDKQMESAQSAGQAANIAFQKLALTSSTTALPAIKKLLGWVVKAVDFVLKFGKWLGEGFFALEPILKRVGGLLATIGKLFVAIYSGQVLKIPGLVKELAKKVKDTITGFATDVKTFKKNMKVLESTVGETVTKAVDDSEARLKKFADSVGMSVEDLLKGTEKVTPEMIKKMENIVARLKATTKTALAEIDGMYKQGIISLDDYIAQRRNLIVRQNTSELNLLKLRKKAEEDVEKETKIDTSIIEKKEELQRELLKLQQKEIKEAKKLADKREKIEIRIQSIRANSLNSLKAVHDQELASLKRKNKKELEEARKHNDALLTYRLEQAHELKEIELLAKQAEEREKNERDLNIAIAQIRADNYNDAESQMELFALELEKRQAEELAAFKALTEDKKKISAFEREQRLQGEKELAAQQKQIWQQNLENAATVSGGLKDIFRDLYEASGQRQEEFFYLAQAAAASEVIMSTAAAAMKAYEQMGVYGGIMAAVIIAQGAIQLGKITAQTFQRRAEGGEIFGRSSNDKEDNIPIWTTAGEWVHPVKAVRYYGARVMKAIQNRMIPREVFDGLSLPNFYAKTPKLSFQEGGQVTGVPVGNGEQEVNITNVIDPSLFNQYLSSREGQDSIINTISARQQQVKRIISG